MLLGCIADDFTGASDLANTLAQGGMRVVQYVGTPDAPPAAEVQAGVVALKSRTIPAAAAVAQSLAALDWLRAAGCSQILFKYCSTFDSTAEGNIGPVAAALAEALGETRVVVCPAFPAAGRTIYQGHLFVGDRLLSDTPMKDHPLTPMRDADLRRVLAAQTGWAVGHVAAPVVQQGAGAIRAALAAGDPAMLVVDILADADLHALGAAVSDRRLITGGSGIALGLPANFGIAPSPVAWSGEAGPAAILSGSCSAATRGQVAAWTGPKREIAAAEVVAGIDPAALVAGLSPEAPTLIYSSADPAVVAAAQDRFGRDALAGAIEKLFGALAVELTRRGTRRLVVAGGETSGAVVTALGPRALAIGPEIATGVPALRVEGRPLVLALKSGNFGGPAFFAEALEVLARG